MQRAAIHDLETLRERLKAALDQAPGSAKGVVQTGSELTRPRRASPAATGIDGQEVTNDLGRFVLQEHVFDYRATHGTFPLDHLLSMPAQWIGDVSQGRADPAAVDRWAYLDTETTGLAGGTGTCAFLVGVGSVEESGFRVRLFFMRDYDEEGAMLHGLARHLARFDVLFTYNGKSFDVPLLETRYRMQRQRNPLAALGHVDLLHPARRLWSARMPNCRLATLEAAILGFARHGDIPGSLIPQRYFDFLRTRHGAPLGPVFHHNVRDILSLACLGSVVMSSYSDPVNAPLRH